MSIIWTIIIGLIAGALAKLIMPGKDPVSSYHYDVKLVLPAHFYLHTWESLLVFIRKVRPQDL